jgi:selenocysteine lyase/cysteine desulfurase
VNYLASLAAEHLAELGTVPTRRMLLQAAMSAIEERERRLCGRLIDGLAGVRWLKIWGITDPARLRERVPTVSFTLRSQAPRQLAERLANSGIFAWSGHFYAVALTSRLGLDPSGGLLRVGLAHYNTEEEVGRLLDVLHEL